MTPANPSIPRAEPLDGKERVCANCHTSIKQVPGGHGPVWIHERTGLVFCTREGS